MVIKGNISSINAATNQAEVILLEYDDAVTAPLPLYRSYTNYQIGQPVVVVVFNGDFNDAVVL